ncbi:DNA polymerase III subunit delta, partial [Cellulomonas bogoriensis 69B4 = DSM 16987]
MTPPRTSARGSARGTSRGSSGVSWKDVEPAPVVLVMGSEALLAERAVERVLARARQEDPAVEVTRLSAPGYEAGTLGVAASPSLFDEARVVVVDDLHQGTDAAFADAVAYAGAPAPDVVLVLRHGGGVRGRKYLDALRAAGAVAVVCDPIKRDADKAAFVADEVARAGRRADQGAVRALVEAYGSDLRELAAACQQLVADTSGVLTAATVASYHGGRVEATGFRVADAATAGRAGEAVALLRHALATGTDPVPLVAALAVKLRTLAKVAAARGRG